MAFNALALSAGFATGLATKVDLGTFAFAGQGTVSAALAVASATGQSLPPAPPPTTGVNVHASASGGNLNIGWEFSLSGGTAGSVTQTQASYQSSSLIFSGPPLSFDAFSPLGHGPTIA